MKKQKVIEPSEILIGDDGTVRDKPEEATPWIRFLARMFDYSFFFTGLWAISRGKIESSLVPYEYFLWIPVEAAFLRWLGTTPGKWLLGIKLQQGRFLQLDYLTALRRSFHVWFRGLGMGIPFINVVCMLVAFQRLKAFKTTTWDRDDHIHVSYRRGGKWRIVLAVIITIGGLGFYFSEKHEILKTKEESNPRGWKNSKSNT
jgi:hypothetical protein